MRIDALLCLQLLQVAILLLHDWVPLGPLNNLAAIRTSRTTRELLLGTVVSSLLPAFGLGLSLWYWRAGWPGWVRHYLLFAYGFLFIGELEAWWVPYWIWPQPKRSEEYARAYDQTHACLPTRNGIRPNTLHVLLHAMTVATLILLAL